MTKTTRQFINETATRYTKLLMLIIGRTDEDIDAILDSEALEHIHGVAKRVLTDAETIVFKGESEEWRPAEKFQALGRLLREKPDDG